MKVSNRVKWSERSKSEKILILTKLTISILILSAAVLQLLKLWPDAMDFAIPLFGVYYLLEMVLNWKKDRDIAALSLIMAIIIFGICIAVFFL